LPAMIPWLHLGEMIYHPASEPTGMSLGSSSLVQSALALEPEELAGRRRRAAALDTLLDKARGLAKTIQVRGSESGYLRYAVRDTSAGRRVDPALGIVRPYRETLAEQQPLRPALQPAEPATPGAAELSRSLYTLPVHQFVSASDLARLGGWIGSSVDRVV